jgi:transcriptional regulator with XRE-family HTH domain
MGMTRTPAATLVDEGIGARIRERREELGFPQRHVADLVGVTYQQFQKYETGANRVSAANLVKIAAALRLDPAELLPGAAAANRTRKAASEDGMALQLQSAYARLKSVKERRLILDLTKRLGAAAAAGAAKKKRRT